jgi:hypothetical protein
MHIKSILRRRGPPHRTENRYHSSTIGSIGAAAMSGPASSKPGSPGTFTRGCKICDGAAERFDVVDFAKTCSIPDVYPRGLRGIPVYYNRCRACGFIFTDQFDGFGRKEWSEWVYNDEYGSVDPDYLENRPRANARLVERFLIGRKHTTVGLDFGGGSGLTAELLTRRGWCFDCYDPFGETRLVPSRLETYNVATAFEVFEHLPDPVAALESILEKMTRGALIILIGTGVSDGKVDPGARLSWWYAAPRNGHISLFSKKSLALLARRFALDHTSASNGLHLLTRGTALRPLVVRLLAAMCALRMEALVSRRH